MYTFTLVPVEEESEKDDDSENLMSDSSDDEFLPCAPIPDDLALPLAPSSINVTYSRDHGFINFAVVPREGLRRAVSYYREEQRIPEGELGGNRTVPAVRAAHAGSSATERTELVSAVSIESDSIGDGKCRGLYIHAPSELSNKDTVLRAGMKKGSARILFWFPSPSGQKLTPEGHTGIIMRDKDGAYYHIGLYAKGHRGAGVFKKYCCFLPAKLATGFYTSHAEESPRYVGDYEIKNQNPDLIIDVLNLDTEKMVVYYKKILANEGADKLHWRMYGDTGCPFGLGARYHNCSSLVYKLLKIGGLENNFRWYEQSRSVSLKWTAIAILNIITALLIVWLYDDSLGDDELDHKQELGLVGLLLLPMSVAFCCVGGASMCAEHYVYSPEGITRPSTLQQRLLLAAYDSSKPSIQLVRGATDDLETVIVSTEVANFHV